MSESKRRFKIRYNKIVAEVLMVALVALILVIGMLMSW